MYIKHDYPCDGCGYKARAVVFRKEGICVRCLASAMTNLAGSLSATVILEDIRAKRKDDARNTKVVSNSDDAA